MWFVWYVRAFFISAFFEMGLSSPKSGLAPEMASVFSDVLMYFISAVILMAFIEACWRGTGWAYDKGIPLLMARWKAWRTSAVAS